MEAEIVIALIDLAMRAWPKVQERIARGEVSVEEQRALLAKYQELQVNFDSYFVGPEWEVTKKV